MPTGIARKDRLCERRRRLASSSCAFRIASFPSRAKRPNGRSAPLLIARGRSAPGPFLSAGDTIPIATMRRPIRSPVRFSVGSGNSDCSSMSSGDRLFRPRLRLIRLVGLGSRLIQRLSKGSAAPLPRTARRQRISSKTIPTDFDSPRADWPASIFRMNSFSRATHERAAPNTQARPFRRTLRG
jgi:hypothetical protein